MQLSFIILRVKRVGSGKCSGCFLRSKPQPRPESKQQKPKTTKTKLTPQHRTGLRTHRVRAQSGRAEPQTRSNKSQRNPGRRKSNTEEN